LPRAANADVWINGGDWKSLKTMRIEEERYREFRPYRSGQIWFYNKRVNPDGGNDYWSRGTTRPDLILADLIKIFHPDLGGRSRLCVVQTGAGGLSRTSELYETCPRR
jgi:iron complex transport system substrate-binding protein